MFEKEKGLNVGEARRMAYDRNEWREFVRVNAWGIARRMNPSLGRDATVLGCHSYMKPLGVEVCLWPNL